MIYNRTERIRWIAPLYLAILLPTVRVIWYSGNSDLATVPTIVSGRICAGEKTYRSGGGKDGLKSLKYSQSLNILLIDDDPDSIHITRGFLSQVRDAAYVVQWVDCFEEGLETLRQGRHDACLLDYQLGERNGLELLRQAVSENCRIPIILLTGQGDRDVDLQAMEAGAADFLAKDGLTGALLERGLRYAIDRRKAENQRLLDEAHRRLITEHLPAILWTTDPQFRFTSIMGTGLSQLDLHPEVLIGKTLFDYLQTTNADDPTIAAHRRALDGESVSYETVWKERMFQIRVEPLRRSSHHAEGTIAVALDITEQRRVEVGFQIAREIQQRLLPQHAPQLAGFDIAGICRPTEATGGDLFDFVPMSDGTLGIVVADVSSHGFGPALIMVESRRVVRTLAATCHDLPTIMNGANQAIFEDTLPGVFVTAFFAHLDPRSRTVNYFGAGHEGYVIDVTGTRKTLESSSFPWGITDEFEYDSRPAVQLQPGDLLVLITDGFMEAMAADYSLYKIDRVLNVIHAHRDQSAAEILEILYQSVLDFCYPLRPLDDITGVIVKLNTVADAQTDHNRH